MQNDIKYARSITNTNHEIEFLRKLYFSIFNIYLIYNCLLSYASVTFVGLDL